MSQMTVSDWRTFLGARLAQEQGKDDEALPVYEQLLEKYPDDVHLTTAQMYALQRLGRSEEAMLSNLSVKYTQVGRELIGERDRPEDWSRRLGDLVAAVDDFSLTNRFEEVGVCW